MVTQKQERTQRPIHVIWSVKGIRLEWAKSQIGNTPFVHALPSNISTVKNTGPWLVKFWTAHNFVTNYRQGFINCTTLPSCDWWRPGVSTRINRNNWMVSVRKLRTGLGQIFKVSGERQGDIISMSFANMRVLV